MKVTKFAFTMILLGSLTFAGCREEKTAGEKIEDGIEEAGDGIEEGVEEAGDEMEDAVDDN